VTALLPNFLLLAYLTLFCENYFVEHFNRLVLCTWSSFVTHTRANYLTTGTYDVMLSKFFFIPYILSTGTVNRPLSKYAWIGNTLSTYVTQEIVYNKFSDTSLSFVSDLFSTQVTQGLEKSPW
jgi:hypothetical protein